MKKKAILQMKESLPSRILFLVVVFLLALSLPWAAATAQPDEEGTLSGSLKTDLYLHPAETGDFINYNSSLDLDYSLDSFTLGSTTRLKNTGGTTGLSNQSLQLDGRLGIFDVSSEAVFVPEENRLDYWLSESSVTFGGATIETLLLLEYVSKSGYITPFPGKFGAGAELTLKKASSKGMTVDIKNRFGLKESESEVLGKTSGSGYDIDLIEFDSSGDPLPRYKALKSLNNFHYVNTVAEIGELSFDCCSFDTETKFSRKNGFEYTLFDFRIESDDYPLTLDTEVKFSPQTKSVTLDPEIDVTYDCFTVYMDMLEDGSDTYSYDLAFEGIELRQMPLGPVRVSSITSLQGNLYRNYGTSNLKLRAYDYLIDPDKPSHYLETSFDEVFSIEARSSSSSGYPSFNLGLDFYFDTSNGKNLFDLSLVTLNGKNSLSEDFDLGTGVSLDPEEGPTEIFFELDYYF